MAPIPSSSSSTPLLLDIHFPSLSSLSSPTLKSRIASAASTTSALTLLVTFSFPLPSHSPPSIPSSSTSSSSSFTSAPTTSTSSSSSSAVPATSGTSLFELLESLLGKLYSAATEVFIKEDRPLDTVDVVLKDVRRLPICWPNEGRREKFVVGSGSDSSDSGEGEVKEQEVGGQYTVCALGGTFDHIHAGHKILLSLSAVLASKRMVVGVTDSALLVNKTMAHHLESLDERIQSSRKFLELFKPELVYDVVPITDVYGPTAWDAEIQALIVSDETRSGGAAVNEERGRKSLTQLDIFVISLIGDDGAADGVEVATKMGSTGIRKWIEKRKLSSSGVGNKKSGL